MKTKHTKLIALILVVLMVLTTLPNIFANLNQGGGGTVTGEDRGTAMKNPPPANFNPETSNQQGGQGGTRARTSHYEFSIDFGNGIYASALFQVNYRSNPNAGWHHHYVTFIDNLIRLNKEDMPRTVSDLTNRFFAGANYRRIHPGLTDELVRLWASGQLPHPTLPGTIGNPYVHFAGTQSLINVGSAAAGMTGTVQHRYRDFMVAGFLGETLHLEMTQHQNVPPYNSGPRPQHHFGPIIRGGSVPAGIEATQAYTLSTAPLRPTPGVSSIVTDRNFHTMQGFGTGWAIGPDARWGSLFGIIQLQAIEAPLPALTLIKVHEYGYTDHKTGEFVVDETRTRHEIIPIADDNDRGMGYQWQNQETWRDINTGTLISRVEPILRGGRAQYDFSTTNLVGWHTITNTHVEDDFHSRRGIPEGVIRDAVQFNQRTTIPLEDGVSNWHWGLEHEGATAWEDIYSAISSHIVDSAEFDEDPEPFPIDILVDLFGEDEEIPEDAIHSQVVFLHYQHPESEFWRVVIIRRYGPDGTYTDELYEEPVQLPTDEIHHWEHPDFDIEEWFV